MFTASADGVDLWFDTVGAGAAVALVPGRGDSADLYPERFVSPLVAAGLRVVRYDPRDTGESGDGGESYGIADLAGDVVEVLDAAGVEAAHLVGLSMGGLILTELAAIVPRRVLSLSFISAASPDPDAGIGPDFFDMMSDDPVGTFVNAMHGATAEDRAWVAAEIEAAEARAGGRRPEAGERHQASVYRSVFPALESLGSIAVPTLVIHGTDDRKLPMAHGQAYAAGVPGASLHQMAGMGHLPRPDQWDEIAALVVDHITVGQE